MNLVRILSMVALAAQLVPGADGPAGGKDAGPVIRIAPAPIAAPVGQLPRVLRRLEPSDNVVIQLPGSVAEPVVAAEKPEPVRPVAPVPAAILVSTHWRPGVPAMPPVPEVEPFQSESILGMASALPAFLTGPINTPAKAFVPPVSHVADAPAAPLPPAPEVHVASARESGEVTSLLASLSVSTSRSTDMPGSSVPKPAYPAVLTQESAVFCQRQIGSWTLEQAQAVLGQPERSRAAFDDNRTENGQIYAFKDPSGRYRELELDFDKTNGTLRTVFVYPWNLTWFDCRRLWGNKVTATEGKQGRMFYSYLNRRLDVLVDQAGKVISLGLY